MKTIKYTVDQSGVVVALTTNTTKAAHATVVRAAVKR